MSKALHRVILAEMQQITSRLVEAGLADDINKPYVLDLGSRRVSVASCNINYAAMLKKQPYRDLYYAQLADRAFSLKMLDGALLQMTYEFNRGALMRSRLAYLPSPDLLDYENNPELYEEDSLFADIVEPSGTIIPLRFDFDVRAGVSQSLIHPASHLTLGEFTRCRIATTGPLSPWLFVGLILRGFYSGGLARLDPPLPIDSHRMKATITAEEKHYVHIGVPVTPY